MNYNQIRQTFNLSIPQIEALFALKARGWTLNFDNFQHLPGEKAVVIQVIGGSGMIMFMVIEPDGHIHS
ncbi:hypothetical protein UFOVP510_55 [uncultured Caudovirales phage]|uniref:Uncharacterized protein n=1 Tax=uncultured Caudovirales phage TaxID=2100421 RepID=A0A6J5MQA4_9CAUD|nr:hypothetical protein UFOVP510_55 [uncultured Caudovirales phage]